MANFKNRKLIVLLYQQTIAELTKCLQDRVSVRQNVKGKSREQDLTGTEEATRKAVKKSGSERKETE